MSYTPMALAEAFIKTGELHDALQALNQQLASQPDDTAARRMRVAVQLRLDDVQYLQQALSDIDALPTKTAQDYLYESIIYEKLKQFPQAIAAIEAARQCAPDDARLIERHLNLLIAHKSIDAAMILVREQEASWRWLEREGDLLVMQGDDTTATARYGLVLAHLGHLAATMRSDYLAALKARVYLARAHAYRRLQHIATAREHYLAAQKLLPDDPTIQFNLGILQWLQGAEEAAYAACLSAWQAAPPLLQAGMRQTLQDDPLLASLAERMLNK